MPAGATSVVPPLAEGESLIAADIAESSQRRLFLRLRLPAEGGADFAGRGDAPQARLRQPRTRPPPSRSTSLARSAAVTPSDKPRTALFFILGTPSSR